MSAGAPHKHGHEPNEDHLKELAKLEKTAWFKAGLAIKFKVVQTFDIPYVGGVSVDGTEIFIDEHFPSKVQVRPYGLIDIRPGLIVHERWEGILLRQGYEYHAAHDFATAAENRVYRAHGWDPRRVQACYPRYEKTDESEDLDHGVPANLDLRPYLAPPVDKALVRRIKAAMATVKGGADTILERRQ
jgi:hypothetical protein